jgi:serine/threonine protein kinase
MKADVWSIGVVLYEMLFGVCPYEDRTIPMLLNKINSKKLDFPTDK